MRACIAALYALSLPLLGDTVPIAPRDGWTFVEGAEDLLQTGSWECVAGVSATAGKLSISTTDGYSTPINTNGPSLRLHGDFSVLATMTASDNSGAFLTLVGKLNQGEWWNGLKRLDVGVGQVILVKVWTGSSPNPTMQWLPNPSLSDLYTLEVARLGTQIAVFVNGIEAGRIDDSGVFDSGQALLGFNVATQNTLSVLALAAAIPSDGSSATALNAPYLQVATRTGTALRDLAGQRGFLVGAAINPSLFSVDAYAETVGREYNLLVAENAMKFAATHPAPDRYTFCAADHLVAYAEANNMQVRGHTLVWHNALPDWVTKGTFSHDEAVNLLHDHISTVAGHFKGKLLSWDVVNESISYSPPYGPQPSFWLNTIGPEYVDIAFRYARQADPDVKLFYNETGGDGLGTKSDVLYNLVKGMLDRGVPLDGVGLQMHIDTTRPPSPDSISANIQRLGQLGLEVHITEMDVRIPVPGSAVSLAAQADIYQGVTSACLANSNCKALLTWGVSDAYSWIPGAYPGFGAALLFDEQFQPKPAYQGVASALSN